MTEPIKTLLVLGGTSDIGRASALAFAQAGWSIKLAGRSEEALSRDAADIATRSGASVAIHRFDVLDTAGFEAFVAGLGGLPDAVLCMVGLLGEQGRAESDLDHATLVMRSNYEGPSLILGLFAERFIARGNGLLIGVSSVAGDRGRGSNYVYGSAKAGFTAFLSGLRNRCHRHGVLVQTVKPGFVRTSMTKDMAFPAPLTATPEVVAQAILNGVQRKRAVVYAPFHWRFIMAMICAIPEPLFKKLSL